MVARNLTLDVFDLVAVNSNYLNLLRIVELPFEEHSATAGDQTNAIFWYIGKAKK